MKAMKVIVSDFLPFRGFAAINLFGIVIARKDRLPLSQRILHHEAIHTHQIKELFYIGFYGWYIVEWLFRLIYYRNSKEAYKNICFEREAFCNDVNPNYLKQRKRYAFLHYIK
ncbi:MAG: hypothetical protein PHQ56_04895 [Dysgonamonadaceae bacterium]|nr:hypothetical protein [Dysgonamonadaceae bacterium]